MMRCWFARIPTCVTVSVFGRLRLNLLLPVYRALAGLVYGFDFLVTARIASAQVLPPCGRLGCYCLAGQNPAHGCEIATSACGDVVTERLFVSSRAAHLQPECMTKERSVSHCSAALPPDAIAPICLPPWNP